MRFIDPKAAPTDAAASLAIAFGLAVKAARADLGISQRHAAKRAGLTQSKVWLAESGRAGNMSIRVLCKLAAAVGGSVKLCLVVPD